MGFSDMLNTVPNRAWPWLLLTLGVVASPALVAILASLDFGPHLSPGRLWIGVVFISAIYAGVVGVFTWAYSYRAPTSVVITDSGVRCVIRFSPLKRFAPRSLDIAFDQVRSIHALFPFWAVRFNTPVGGTWFVYLSRKNALTAREAWKTWKSSVG